MGDNKLPEDQIIPGPETMSNVIVAFHEKEIRMQLTESFKIIGTPREVVSLKGL